VHVRRRFAREALTRRLAIGASVWALAAGLAVGSGPVRPAGSAGLPQPIPPPGYRLLAADGGVFAFSAPFEGSAASDPARCPANPPGRDLPNGSCGFIARTTGSPNGYYILNSFSGSIYTYGDAVSFGQPAGSGPYAGPSEFWPKAVAMAVTGDDRGYWVLEEGASGLGSVQVFGDAQFYGDEVTAHVAHNGRPVGIVADSGGYLIVDSDGGVFAFGDAVFSGSMGGQRLNAPVVGVAGSAGSGAYWLVGADGGVFNFGGEPFGGSLAGTRLNAPIVAIVPNPSFAGGYWLVGADGGVFALGGAPYFGSMGGIPLDAPIVAATT
jgi:hypothetical protein